MSAEPISETATPDEKQAQARGLFYRKVRQLVCYCLPALIVGAGLRIAVTVSMPYGYVQYDTSDFLHTTKELILEHKFKVHGKRSYLTPGLFAACFAIPAPALITIPAAQHLMGLLGVLVVGALVRLWFKHWKWFVFPATLVFAANPMLIWYEHTLLGEAQYLFFMLVTALAATVWVRRPSTLTFAMFLLSLFAITGTRLEGKLFFAVALLLLPFMYWQNRRRLIVSVLASIALACFGVSWSGGRDGSPLLLATLLAFTPDHLRCAPDFEPYLIPLRDHVRETAPEYPAELVRLSKQIKKAAYTYHQDKHHTTEGKSKATSKLLNAVCMEIVRSQPLAVSTLPLVKFRLALDAWSAYLWDSRSLGARQATALSKLDWMHKVLSRGLTGQQRSPEQIAQWVAQSYDPQRIAWFSAFQENWNRARIYFRTADSTAPQMRSVHDFFGGVPGGAQSLPGVPYYYFLALAGMIGAAAFKRPMRYLHLVWIGTTFGIMYLALFVGVTNARFRFAYEPFFFLYFLLLIELVFGFGGRACAEILSRKKR